MSTKYPCGNCGIGVRFSGIKRTGLCNNWYHADCQNILDKVLKKLTRQEIGKWKCTNCSADKQPQLLNQVFTDSLSLNSSDTIQELENSLIAYNILENSNSREDKLEMAAKIGSALVEENKLLKDATLKLKTKLSIMEEKLEEMGNEEKKHLHKIENLLQLNADVEAQLTKEKKLSQEAQFIYEEHDLQLRQHMDSYVKRIAELEKTVLTLQKKTENQETKTFHDSETQTSPPAEIIKDSPPSSLIFEMSGIKTKLDRMEIAINTLAINTLTSGDRQTCNEKLNNTLTEVDLTSRTNQTCQEKLENSLTDIRTHSTSGTSQTCNEKLYALTECGPHHQTSGTSQTCNEKLYALTECSPHHQTSGTSQTCNEKLYALTECSPHHQTSGTSQTYAETTIKEHLAPLSLEVIQLRSGQGRMEQLMESLSIKLELLARTTPPASLNICTSVEQTHLKHNAITKMRNPEEVEENHYSVSLQMAKANALLKKNTIMKPALESILSSQEGKSTENANAFKVQRGPPITAKKLGTDESLEKFFMDNIESAMKINMNYFSPPHQAASYIWNCIRGYHIYSKYFFRAQTNERGQIKETVCNEYIHPPSKCGWPGK
ncbi:hypothetical protein J6590_077612 [Homalodisca vitripennis]|nr:hypothetical protein J6590_077612 [Homalodisca vitripennis]